MIMSGNNKGNPNHDENGKFTSQGNNRAGGAKPNPNKMNANTGNQPADFAAGLWNSYTDNQGEEDETSKLLRMLRLMNGDLDEEDQEKKELVEETKQQNELDTQEETQGREEAFNNVNAKLSEMGFGIDEHNRIYEAKRDLAYKGGWRPDREGNPKNDVNHFLINKSLDNLKKGYSMETDVESPVNKEWAEDLGYQLKVDGVPEEAIPELLGIFESEAPSWEEAHQKQSDQKALDDLGAKMDKLEGNSKVLKQMGLEEDMPHKRYRNQNGMIVVVDEDGNPTGEQYPSIENAEDINGTIKDWEEVD